MLKRLNILTVIVGALVLICCKEGKQKEIINIHPNPEYIPEAIKTKRLNSEELYAYLEKVPKGDTVFSEPYLNLIKLLDPVTDSSDYRIVLKHWRSSSENTMDTLALAKVERRWYYFFRKHNLVDSAYFFANRAHDLSLTTDDTLLQATSIYNRAIAEYLLLDFYTSQKSLFNALKILEKNESELATNRKISCYNLLGSNSLALKNYESALEYRSKALKLLDNKSFSNMSYLSLLNNLGTVKHEIGEYSDAIDYYNQITSNDSVRQLFPELYARTLVNQGRSELALGHLDRIEARYLEALHLRDSLRASRSLARSYYFLAEYYWQINDTSKAKTAVYNSSRVAREESELDALQDIIVLMAQIEPEKASLLMIELDSLKDEISVKERQIRDKYARVRFNTDAYIAENKDLERKQLMYIGILTGVLLLGTAVFIIISQQIRNQKLRFEQKQQETNEEVFNLMLTQNEKIEKSKKKEQKRISEDLHDGVLGEMNGIRMVLLGLNEKSDEASQSMRKQAITKLQTVQEEIRTISHQLNDSAYEKFHNFILSLEELLEDFCGAAGLAYKLQFDKDFDWDNLDGIVKINTYRIIQECIQNTVKHAEATEVTVNLMAMDNYCEVSIADNGIGFELSKGKRGIGQKNIKSRVEKMNGRWEIKSASGQGTEVIIKMPVGWSENETNITPA